MTAQQNQKYNTKAASLVTETMAAVMSPILDTSNASYASATTTTLALPYWSSDGDGDGGGSAVTVSASYSELMAAVGSTQVYNDTQPLDHNSSDYYEYPPPCLAFDESANVTYWNVTCDNPLEYGLPLYGYIMPVLLVVTVVTNSLIVLVLSKKHLATPTNFVLMVMAICDMLTVIFPAPGLWYMYTFGNHYKPLHPVSMCLTYSIFNELMPAVCHTASIWLTLALAVQRYIYVCHAPMARTWCTMPRVKRSITYIALVAFLHQATRFFDRTYFPITIEWNGQQTEVCHVETSEWVHNYLGEDFYFATYFLFRVVFVHVIPCILLVTLNALLFRAMREAKERRKALFRDNQKVESRKLRDSNCTTYMLMTVVSVFLAVEIPIAVVTVLHIFSSLMDEFLNYRIANISIMFTNFFLVLSYPINFGIYCGMSRQFRETFKDIFFAPFLTKQEATSKYSIVNGPRSCTNTNETVL
ncbi:sex peptide receptor [Zeugodacus cucurbitae]|uniref:FMRFamide receptor n=1 Tax=Zeugodacus cucurbitae TaxID=28588 RepID=A0A0A1WWG3_ZEUCU|nr:sex peptide receptor [Zeugodacus cucurbitae]XP_011189259.1 sex peptide receptor [Zeugodacus cucurbitae]XP_054088565.1 sex peptide receptor [Zeugodacus cucurbitae]XP_054088566.1 sex peptide receptor [Zeugodacus cucurbitae]